MNDGSFFKLNLSWVCQLRFNLNLTWNNRIMSEMEFHWTSLNKYFESLDIDEFTGFVNCSLSTQSEGFVVAESFRNEKLDELFCMQVLACICYLYGSLVRNPASKDFFPRSFGISDHFHWESLWSHTSCQISASVLSIIDSWSWKIFKLLFSVNFSIKKRFVMHRLSPSLI